MLKLHLGDTPHALVDDDYKQLATQTDGYVQWSWTSMRMGDKSCIDALAPIYQFWFVKRLWNLFGNVNKLVFSFGYATSTKSWNVGAF